MHSAVGFKPMRTWVALIVLSGFALLATNCQLIASPDSGEGELLSSTVQVTRGDMADVVQIAGQVVAKESRELSFGTVGGRVSQVYAGLGQEVQTGMALVQLDTSSLERTWREAQAGSKIAEAALAEAQRTAAKAEIAQARADLSNAEYALAASTRDLARAEGLGLEPYQDAVANARSDVQGAQDERALLEIQFRASEIRRLEYEQAFFQRKLRDLAPGAEYDETQKGLLDVNNKLDTARADRSKALKQAQERIEEKELALEEAKSELARIQSGEQDPLAPLRLNHEQAQLAEQDARQYLADLEAGLDSAAVKAARTNLEAAQAKVVDAQAAIEDATLVSPFDGVVMQFNAQVGQWVSSSDSLVYLVNMSELRVRAQVTEVDIAKLELGQAVRISFDSDPRTIYPGEIVKLPAKGESSGGMSYYQVESSIQASNKVRPNTLANLRIVVGDKRDVLLVPAAALQYLSSRYGNVTVLAADGQMRTAQIETGLNDGIMVEVLSGLEQGDTLVMPLVAPGQSEGGQVMPVEPVEVEVGG